MKSHLFRICIALFTLAVGIGGTSLWIIRHRTSPSSSVVSLPATKPSSPVGESLPCADARRDVAAVKDLLAAGIKVDSTADSCIHGEPSPRCVTLLMKAAGDGDIEIVRLLLDHGANVNAADSWKDTPLFYAVGYTHLEIVNLLIEKGADVNAKGEWDRTILMSACGGGDLDVINVLLDHGADINAKDQNGTTALMFAAGDKQPAVMNLLLNRGANPNMKDKAGRTASVYAKKGFPKEYYIVKD